MFAKTLPFAAVLLAGSAQAASKTWQGETCPVLTLDTTTQFLDSRQRYIMNEADGKTELFMTFEQNIVSGANFDTNTEYSLKGALPSNTDGSAIDKYYVFETKMI